MNVFNLFETKNIENIKLGVQIIKTLGYQKDFEVFFKRSFIGYDDVFTNIVLVMNEDVELIEETSIIVDNNFNISELSGFNITWIVSSQPQLINRFDLAKLDGDNISWILQSQPQLIDKFDLSKLGKGNISYLLQSQPQLIDKCDLSKLSKGNISLLIKYQAQLASYFNK